MHMKAAECVSIRALGLSVGVPATRKWRELTMMPMTVTATLACTLPGAAGSANTLLATSISSPDICGAPSLHQRVDPWNVQTHACCLTTT